MTKTTLMPKIHTPNSTEIEAVVAAAIDESVATDCIIHLDERDYPRAANDLHDELDRLSEGTATNAPYDGVEVIEYWGVRRDGQEWRIHVHC